MNYANLTFYQIPKPQKLSWPLSYSPFIPGQTWGDVAASFGGSLTLLLRSTMESGLQALDCEDIALYLPCPLHPMATVPAMSPQVRKLLPKPLPNTISWTFGHSSSGFYLLLTPLLIPFFKVEFLGLPIREVLPFYSVTFSRRNINHGELYSSVTTVLFTYGSKPGSCRLRPHESNLAHYVF